MSRARLAECLAILTLVPASALPAAAQTALAGPDEATARQARVRSDITPCLNLRLSPSSQASVVDCLDPAVGLTLFESREGWSRVRLDDGRQGWVATRFLEVSQMPRPASAPRAERSATLPLPPSEPAPAAVDPPPETFAEPADSDLEARARVLESQVLAYRSAEKALRERLERSEALTAELRRQLDEQQAGGEDDDGGLSRARSDATAARQANQELELQLRSSRDEVERLRSELDASRRTEAELRRELERALAPDGETGQEIADLRSELEASRRAEADLRRELEEALLPDAELLAEVEALRSAEAMRQQLNATRTAAPGQSDETPVAVRPPRSSEQPVRAPLAAIATDEETVATAPESETPEGPLVPVDTDVVELVGEPVVDEEAGQIDSEDLRSLVIAWAEAWSGQRVDEYLSYYSPSFRPAEGMSRELWASRRRDRLTAPELIQVELEAIDILPERPVGRREVRFLQTYESDTFNDKVIKSLVFTLEDGEWKILRETALETISEP